MILNRFYKNSPAGLSLFLFVWLFFSLPAEAETLRIISLNAEWFPGRSPEPSVFAEQLHMHQLQQMLAYENPDILLLQEIRHSQSVTQLLAVLPDFELHTISHFNGSQKLAVASRFEALAAWSKQWYAEEKYHPPRGFAAAVLELPGAQSLAVYSVHFKSNYQAEDGDALTNAVLREVAATQLLEHSKQLLTQQWRHPLLGVVAGGDINTTYPLPLVDGEKTFKILEQGGLKPLGPGGIDHFLAGGAARSGRTRILDRYSVSDHKPILFEFELDDELVWEKAEPLDLYPDGTAHIVMDINHASVNDLVLLPGIGTVLAQRIIEHRPYHSLEELIDISGIGPVRWEIIREKFNVTPVIDP